MITDIVYADEKTIFIMNDMAMMPQLKPGSALSGNYINRCSWSKLTNGVYAIVLTDGTILIRRIEGTDKLSQGSLELSSDSIGYQNEVINKNEIVSIYAIESIIRQEVI